MFRKITKPQGLKRALGLIITGVTLSAASTNYVYGECYCACMLMGPDTEMKCQSDRYKGGLQENSEACAKSCFGFNKPVVQSFCGTISQIDSFNKCEKDISDFKNKCQKFQDECVKADEECKKDTGKCEESKKICEEAAKKCEDALK